MALVMEAGAHVNQLKRVLDFNITKIAGCLLTHEHGDHAGHVKNYLRAGIDVYASQGTIDALGISHHRLHPLKAMQKQIIKGFSVLPFDVKHDCAEPLGFLINHPDTGTFVFATDTYYIPYTFQGLNNVLIECNYSRDILDENVRNGLATSIRDRVIQSHMELQTCKDFLSANDLSQVHNIVLLHLSDTNSHAEQFRSTIQELTGKPVFIADKGSQIQISKKAF